MNLPNRIFAFFINSSIHVALAVTSLMMITVLEHNLHVPKALWFFVFLGSITGYNFVKYAKVAGLHHRTLTHSLKTIQVFSFLCFVLLCFFSFQLSIEILLSTAGFALFTFFYAVPFQKNKNLRTLPALKIFIVALVWAGVTVIVPIIASKSIMTLEIWITFFQRVFIVIVLILPFEIRDVPYDSYSLKTFPQQLGVKSTKLMGIVFLLICIILELIKQTSSTVYLLGLIVFCIILGGMLWISKTHQSRYFASFWVEGLPIVWLIVLWGLIAFQL